MASTVIFPFSLFSLIVLDRVKYKTMKFGEQRAIPLQISGAGAVLLSEPGCSRYLDGCISRRARGGAFAARGGIAVVWNFQSHLSHLILYFLFFARRRLDIN